MSHEQRNDEPAFPGVIGTTVSESTPWWPTGSHGERTRPNVVMIVLDDTGWSDLGCFGSEIATPAFDELARRGVRYNRFHVTPLCSPTRAALLTGRNHHSVGMRFLADTDTGFPNSRGSIREDVPLLPQILRADGYGTYLVGKWHLAPLHEITPAGPYRNWPLARGFDRYFGFMDGCTDQYEPELYEDNHPVQAAPGGERHLTERLADQAIDYVRDHVSFRPDSPFFLQFAVGATHAPFQAPREYIEPYVETFAKGWDAVRSDRLARQIDMGLVPAGTTLSERNDGVSPWEELSDDERMLYAHLQAAFAGFLEHTDAQVGRIMKALQDFGVLDDTIVLVLSDNGASREGGATGDVDTNAPYSGVRRSTQEQLELLDDLGTVRAGAHYPEGWAMAGNTPFRFYKQFVDLGGVRSPLIVAWNHSPVPLSGIRDQFVHAIDVAPTLLDLLELTPGIDMDGQSIARTLEDPAAPAGRGTQYWETLGHRAVWHDGWRAVTSHVPGSGYADDTWRLYHSETDFSESHDLADEHPDRLAELQRLWWSEAERNDVFPLDDRPLRELIAERGPIGLFAASRIVLRPGQSHVPFASAVTGSNRDVVVTAHLAAPTGRVSGSLLSSGNVQGGFLLHLIDGELHFQHSLLGEKATMRAPLGDDPSTVGFALRPAADDSAAVTLLIDGVEAARTEIPRTSAHLSFWGLDVGRIGASSLDETLEPPFAMPDGVLDRVTIDVHAEPDDLVEYAEAVLASE